MLWITVSWSEYDHTNQWPLRRKRLKLQPQFSYDKSKKQFAFVAYAGMTGIKCYPSLNGKPRGSKEIWFVECDGHRALYNHLQRFFKALPFPNVFFWLFPLETETDLRNIPSCMSQYILQRTPRTLIFSTKQPLWWRHLPRLSQPPWHQGRRRRGHSFSHFTPCSTPTPPEVTEFTTKVKT